MECVHSSAFRLARTFTLSGRDLMKLSASIFWTADLLALLPLEAQLTYNNGTSNIVDTTINTFVSVENSSGGDPTTVTFNTGAEVTGDFMDISVGDCSPMKMGRSFCKGFPSRSMGALLPRPEPSATYPELSPAPLRTVRPSATSRLIGILPVMVPSLEHCRFYLSRNRVHSP